MNMDGGISPLPVRGNRFFWRLGTTCQGALRQARTVLAVSGHECLIRPEPASLPRLLRESVWKEQKKRRRKIKALEESRSVFVSPFKPTPRPINSYVRNCSGSQDDTSHRIGKQTKCDGRGGQRNSAIEHSITGGQKDNQELVAFHRGWYFFFLFICIRALGKEKTFY